jgi:hypothetical protein
VSKSHTLVPFHAAEGLTLKQAADVAGKSVRTLRNWSTDHGIGRRVAGGTWVVSKVALAMLLARLSAIGILGCARSTSPWRSITCGSISATCSTCRSSPSEILAMSAKSAVVFAFFAKSAISAVLTSTPIPMMPSSCANTELQNDRHYQVSHAVQRATVTSTRHR